MTLIAPDWVLPGGQLHGVVGAVSTTRKGGVSAAPYDAMNLGDHVGDDPATVAENRRTLAQQVGRDRWLWLQQVHGKRVVHATDWHAGIEADGVIIDNTADVAVIMTADCVPVLLAAHDGSVVAAVHAGWRGLASGVVQQAIAGMGVAPQDLLAWIGPAISQRAFEVGDEVRQSFVAICAGDAEHFQPNAAGRWQADLPALTAAVLARAGVMQVSVDGSCTHADAQRFFSHRRAAPCGRMASAIWRIAADRNA
ncbi:MAG: peptidoglycan editing factor PgeF [Pseudomonadota bacterium]